MDSISNLRDAKVPTEVELIETIIQRETTIEEMYKANEKDRKLYMLIGISIGFLSGLIFVALLAHFK